MTTTFSASPDPYAPPCDFAASRAAMIDNQLRVSDVSDRVLLAAMEQIAREYFVPKTLAALAYIDRPIALTAERELTAPLAMARLIAAADVAPQIISQTTSQATLDRGYSPPSPMPPNGVRLLLVGAATGYMTAVLAVMGARVFALESDPTLLLLARHRLADYSTVHLIEGPLTAGVVTQAPFDRIIIDGAIDYLPIPLIAQLAEGGIVTCALRQARLCRLSRGIKVAGEVRLRAFADMDVAVLPGFAREQAFVF